MAIRHGATTSIARSCGRISGPARANATAMMQDDSCRRTESLVEVWDRIARNATLRRELLWLRAREKSDDGEIRSLERIDPELAERMREWELDADLPDDPRARARAFGKHHDERWAEMTEELLLEMIPCGCSRCSAGGDEP